MTQETKIKVAINPEVAEVISDIIMTLKLNPQEEMTGYIGCGSHARHLNANGKAPQCTDAGSRKIVIAGDSYDMALNELYYLLWDLAVELHIPDEKRELLRSIS